MSEIKTVHISTFTFIKIIALGLLVLFLFLVKGILAMIFLAFVISSAIKPWVHWLENRKIPKVLSIIIIYLIFISILLSLLVLIIPPVSREIGQLAKSFPDYYDKINYSIKQFNRSANPNLAHQIQLGLDNVSNSLSGAIGSIFSKTYQFFSGLFAIISILVIAFYFTNEEGAIRKYIGIAVPDKYKDYLVGLIHRIQVKLGFWFRGQLFLCFIIFGATFLGLLIGGIKYALILGVIAGLFEIIPFFGPWAAGITGVLLSFTQSPGKALYAAIVYLVVQQLENSLIVPNVIGKSVGLNPLIVILAILIGFQLGGVLGAIIAVPVVAVLSVILDDLLKKKNFDEIIS